MIELYGSSQIQRWMPLSQEKAQLPWKIIA